jgi:hypothetical protein
MDPGLPLCVPSAWEATPTASSTAPLSAFGTIPTQPWQLAPTNTCFYDPRGNPCVSIGNEVAVAAIDHTTIVTSVPAVFPTPMEPKDVLVLRRSCPITPYNPTAWEFLLRTHGLLHRYHDIPPGLRNGFNLHLPAILNTQTPPQSYLSFHIQLCL